jgi:hypothetical protein
MHAPCLLAEHDWQSWQVQGQAVVSPTSILYASSGGMQGDELYRRVPCDG